MTQLRLNRICVLHVHNELIDTVVFLDVAKDFVKKNERRKFVFGSDCS